MRSSCRAARTTAIGLVLALILTALAACGLDSSTHVASSPTPTSTTVAPLYPVEPNAYPAYVKHKWGVTKITTEPKRIVALGFRDQESMVALGVTPVAVQNYFGAANPWAKSPWLSPTAQNANYVVVTADVRDPKNGHVTPGNDGPIMPSGFPQAANTPPLKQVYNLDDLRALKPDLITAMFSGVTQEDFQKLQSVAPTITGVSDDSRDYFSSWEEEMQATGAALGRPAAASRIVAQAENQFAALATAHPEIRNARVVVAAPGPNGEFRIINPYGELSRFFTSLHMSFPADIQSVTTPQGKAAYAKAIYSVDFDDGELNLLNGVDVLVMVVGPDGGALMNSLRQTAGYQNLGPVQKGHVLVLDGELAEALYYESPNSIPWAIAQLTPMLAEMLSGRAAKVQSNSGSDDSGGLPTITYKGAPTSTPTPTPSSTRTP
ncbi:MAG TPA: ABC transporter substrate-binding protein [Sporichthyaceae bacterium]|jgi:iron complex transport system substrate-binding protein|nr:ABC transporter substrate-binding protein [Sporichthyaceae bacterium]